MLLERNTGGSKRLSILRSPFVASAYLPACQASWTKRWESGITETLNSGISFADVPDGFAVFNTSAGAGTDIVQNVDCSVFLKRSFIKNHTRGDLFVGFWPWIRTRSTNWPSSPNLPTKAALLWLVSLHFLVDAQQLGVFLISSVEDCHTLSEARLHNSIRLWSLWLLRSSISLEHFYYNGQSLFGFYPFDSSPSMIVLWWWMKWKTKRNWCVWFASIELWIPSLVSAMFVIF